MASKKKRREKKQDFVKQKLKVGKAKPKASSHTDTSFTVKAIHIPLQSVLKQKTSEVELAKNISLTKHNTPQIRKEAALFIQKHINDHPTMTKNLISAVAKLIIDQSTSVRTETLNTLKLFSPINVQLNYNMVILYIQSAMTHINGAIRNDSTKFLEVLIEPLKCIQYMVNNNWIKLIKCFFSLLSWPLDSDKKNISLSVNISSSSDGSSSGNNAAKLRHLQVLNKLIAYGALAKDLTVEEPQQETSNTDGTTENGQKGGKKDQELYPHALTSFYLSPEVPSPFEHLRLFTRSLNHDLNDLNNLRCEDVLLRRKVLVEIFASSMVKELNATSKDGGEVGRYSKNLLLTINQAVENEEEYKKSIGAF